MNSTKRKCRSHTKAANRLVVYFVSLNSGTAKGERVKSGQNSKDFVKQADARRRCF